MKLTADRDGSIRRFSAKLSWREHFDPKEIEILSAGAVPMLIPPLSVQGRRNNVLQYDISPYSTLEFYLTCILSREQFAELLLQTIDVFQRMAQIYLNYKNLVLDLDKIYIQLNDRSIHFIYLPLMSSTREASIPDFFRQVVTKAVRSTYEQSNFLEVCLTWLNRPASFVLSEFEGLIKEQTCAGAVISTQQAVIGKGPDQPVLQQERYIPPTPKKQQQVNPPTPVIVTQGSTAYLDEQPGGTVLLCDAGSAVSGPKIRYYLQRLQPDEKVELTHFPFLVGTELGSVAYYVSGNAAVSRRHAEFSLQDGECVIVDQKSTNKTYINDCMIPPFTPRQLKDGDTIRLGNEKFTFIREEQT